MLIAVAAIAALVLGGAWYTGRLPGVATGQPSGAEFQYADLTPEEREMGKSAYTGVCARCHNNGRFDAPVLDETAEWQRRLDKRGRQTLHKHALHGFKRMPAKGGVEQLSDEQVGFAVEYMLREAGFPP